MWSYTVGSACFVIWITDLALTAMLNYSHEAGTYPTQDKKKGIAMRKVTVAEQIDHVRNLLRWAGFGSNGGVVWRLRVDPDGYLEMQAEVSWQNGEDGDSVFSAWIPAWKLSQSKHLHDIELTLADLIRQRACIESNGDPTIFNPSIAAGILPLRDQDPQLPF